MKTTKLTILNFIIIGLISICLLTFAGCHRVGIKPIAPPSNPDATDTSSEGQTSTEHTHFLVKESREEPSYENAGIITYKCSFCDYCEYHELPKLEHSYSNTLSYNETSHWYACLDKGYDSLKKDEASHSLIAGTVTPATYDTEEYTEYTCACGYSKAMVTGAKLEHTYSSSYSYNDTHHWYGCIDEGYESLKLDETPHSDSNEEIISATTDTTPGRARYTCSVCGHIYEKTIYLKTEILEAPVASGTLYVGQPLSVVELNGGMGSVDGVFSWTNKDEIVTASGEYSVTFTPTQSEVYETLYTSVYVEATQLTVTINAGENGSATLQGVQNVSYGQSITVSFKPNNDYAIEEILLDGIAQEITSQLTIENITQSHIISVSFLELEVEETLPFVLTYISGTENAYTYDGTTLTFTEITEDTVYSITGELAGNIVFNLVNDYKMELEMCGFTLTSSTINPVTALSGGEISLKAKNGYENYIYDNREAIDQTDETLYSGAVYSLVDLELSGKGSLKIVSENNNGVHTKDDLQVKNLTLSISCVDNALKGNDSVEITNATTTLIATQGDCIKTTNSHINETTLNQKGTISIAGGTHNLYSACDAIDSAYNVVIDDSTTILNIYTDKYSEYSEEVTATSQSSYYLRYNSTAYKFSVLYSNSTTGASEWVNVSSDYETVTSSSNRPGGGSTYYYYTFAKLADYDKITVYMYSSDQEQGQADSYYACSSQKSINSSYDTIALSYRSSSLSVSWTNYSTSSTGGMGGMQEGNSDKGEYSTKGIKSANEIIINEGTITIKAYDDAIHANNDGGTLENGENPTGNVTINGGTITVYSNDDGVHADGTLLVTNGTVNVTNAYEGIEGFFIIIEGGSVSVVSSDDGFNATSTTGAAIDIRGGNVYVYATGDGLDSNSSTSKGAILFSGGTTVVICNSNGNSAIDSDGGYTQTGGRVVAIMTSGGMTSETTNGTTQGMTTKSSLSLSNGGYLNVSIDGETTLVVKMPCSMTAYVVYVGSSSATISASTTSDTALDSNGVYWK